ncbi:hypothetical protein [Roseomonas sp. HF4]|uniref:hypothetical protein n=1 Tax=Roseomonas sp. HF4 TaxID=2562313 RepID=UPI0010BFEC11|nr:hypothetical protein [Roseomonas sp. HF4]
MARLPPPPEGPPLRPPLDRLAPLGGVEWVTVPESGPGHLFRTVMPILARHLPPPPPGAPVLLSLFLDLALLQRADGAKGLLTVVPGHVLDRIRAGEGIVVFDGATEGRAFRAVHAESLHGALAAAGIPASRAAWLQQNRALGAEYRAHCAARGIAPMLTPVADSYGFALWRRLFDADTPPRPPSPPALWPFGFALPDGAPRRLRWICLNFALRPHRAVLAAWLLARPEPGHLSISFRRDVGDARAEARFWADADWFARGQPGLIERARALAAEQLHMPGDAAEFGAPHWRVHSLPVEEIAAAEIFIVTETEMVWPGLRRWTEKTLKALASGLPFVVFGNAGTIAGLEEIGFDVLHGLVDHGYDREPAPERRFAAALDAVRRFLARAPGFTPAELRRLSLAAAHNRDVFARQMPRVTVIEPIEAVLGALAVGGPQARAETASAGGLAATARPAGA